ncbi:unnamed protein product [Caenorhabditis bovis]|uniref:Uncharacterized protein n=1 Tax=Caenorhabditis bovis TaxID=2654633 RepID=A0A8S1EJ25_9PELO|nr:unnamed protein product [Caenorhabditis bovis]
MNSFCLPVLLLTLSNRSVVGFIDNQNHGDPKYFGYRDAAVADVQRHLGEMRKLIVDNRRDSFSNMFRSTIDPQQAFPPNVNLSQFFENVRQNPSIRNSLQINLVSRPTNFGHGRYEFVYQMKYCQPVDDQCLQRSFNKRAFISNKVNSPSGFAFDSFKNV